MNVSNARNLLKLYNELKQGEEYPNMTDDVYFADTEVKMENVVALCLEEFMLHGLFLQEFGG